MGKVLLYSLLLIGGLVVSQFTPRLAGEHYDLVRQVIALLTMIALSFIMIRVGYEFDIDKSNLRQYGMDYLVAATAAAFPWVFCSVYFVLVFHPTVEWDSWDVWRHALLAGRFAAPTSAGVLFSMLLAAGLAATWVFKKARVLAIFDDLDTILFMIPLKMMIVGMQWQLSAVVVLMGVMLWLAWRYLHVWRIPIRWPWVLLYAVLIALASEGVYLLSKHIDPQVPIHIEVLLPAFVLGCMIAKPAAGNNGAGHDASGAAGHGASPAVGRSGASVAAALAGETRRPAAPTAHDNILETPAELWVGTVVSAIFMVLVGLSMPSAVELFAGHGSTWTMLAVHVLLLTLLSNIGKMFAALCYRREAHWRERLAVSVAMFPRGEVGAGVLVISLAYGIGGVTMAAAVLSLALNLLLTGVFIIIVKKLIALPAAR